MGKRDNYYKANQVKAERIQELIQNDRYNKSYDEIQPLNKGRTKSWKFDGHAEQDQVSVKKCKKGD